MISGWDPNATPPPDALLTFPAAFYDRSLGRPAPVRDRVTRLVLGNRHDPVLSGESSRFPEGDFHP